MYTQGLFRSSLPVSGKLIQFPRFGNLIPGVQKPISVELSSERADWFTPAASPDVAKMVLVPETRQHLGRLVDKALASSGLNAILKEIFVRLHLGDKAKPMPEDLIHYVPVSEEEVPAEAAGRANTQAMVNAFSNRLDNLGDEIRTVQVMLPDELPSGVDAEALQRELAMTATLKGYNYRFHRSDNKNPYPLERVQLSYAPETQPLAMSIAVREGTILGEAKNTARHLVDSPANFKTTRYIADLVKTMKSDTLDVQVHQDGFLEGTKGWGNTKRFGLFLSVAQGNDRMNPDKKPRLLEMTYQSKDFDETTGKTILLVGKGIIFDTGGNDLKPSMHQHNMRGDMAGAAAVIGTMQALDKMQLSNVRVVGLTPLTENRLNGNSTLQQDMYTSRSGKKVQITNTDAEGRLVLADAINYGMEKYNGKLSAAFTIATLTGGKVRAIGEHNAIGISGNNPEFLNAVNGVVEGTLRRTTGVHPLTAKYFDMVTQKDGGMADAINASGRSEMEYAGVLKPLDPDKADDETARAEYGKSANLNAFLDGAAFVQAVAFNPKATDIYAKLNKEKQLVPTYQANLPWAHLDIAGAEFGPKDPKRGNGEWATGIGVEDLYLAVKGIAQGAIVPDAEKTEVVS